MGGQTFEQQGHQRAMLAYPAHGRSRGRRPPRAQIRQGEGHLALDGQIQQLQGAEGHQHRLHSWPQTQLLQKALARMGEGIGAAALEQQHGGQWITDAYLPAGVSQSQGRKGTGGACPVHLGPQNRFGLDHDV